MPKNNIVCPHCHLNQNQFHNLIFGTYTSNHFIKKCSVCGQPFSIKKVNGEIIIGKEGA